VKVSMNQVYLEVICGVRVLITGDDLGGHPVRRPDKGVPPPHRAVQLSTHAKVNYADAHTQGSVVCLRGVSFSK